MANTYTQLYVHAVFAVKFRAALIDYEWDERLRLYIIATAQNRGHKMLAINNMQDHMHLLVGLNPSESVSDLLRVVKGESSEWINNEKLTPVKFFWQEGYGAFSHSKSQIDQVVKYIHNQKIHHQKVGFMDEYRKMLGDFGVDFNEKYLFKDPI